MQVASKSSWNKLKFLCNSIILDRKLPTPSTAIKKNFTTSLVFANLQVYIGFQKPKSILGAEWPFFRFAVLPVVSINYEEARKLLRHPKRISSGKALGLKRYWCKELSVSK